VKIIHNNFNRRVLSLKKFIARHQHLVETYSVIYAQMTKDDIGNEILVQNGLLLHYCLTMASVRVVKYKLHIDGSGWYFTINVWNIYYVICVISGT
jgi:hypothetical protein